MHTAALCDAYQLPLSSHTAPCAHLHACCAATPLRHLEYFHDHVRIERLLFEGAAQPQHGYLAPERQRPGLGIELRAKVAEPYRI